MNDEVNYEVTTKVVAITFRAGNFTKDTLAKAMQAYLNNEKHKSGKPKEKHGKMKVSELVGQGQGAASVEITDSNINTFIKIAKKYNVDFAVKKDSTVKPPKYIVFFKAKDTDVISQAFKEYVYENQRQKSKVSVKRKLFNYTKKIIKNKFFNKDKEHKKERTREKNRNRGPER